MIFPWSRFTLSYGHLLLTQFKKRVIKESDSTDIDVISIYLPYVDVFATDAFIADRIAELGIASDYNVDLLMLVLRSLCCS